MGIFKAIGFFVTGGAIRPTTTRERSRMYQRRANNLLEDQLNVMQSLGQQQQFTQVPTDARPRGTCPACMELMLVGASTCPNCHTTGITWPSAPVQTSVSSRRDAFKSPEEKLLAKDAFITQANEKRQAQRDLNQRWRQIKRLKRRQASEDRRLMRENQVIVKQHGIEHAAVLRLVLEDYRIMEEHKDLVLQQGLTDASQVRAYLRERALEKSRIQQLEMEQAQRAKDKQRRADAEARRTLRVLAVMMQQLGLVVQKCLNPEQGVEISEEELRAAFESIRSFLNKHQELSPVGVAKYEKVISELSAAVEDKTGYQNL